MPKITVDWNIDCQKCGQTHDERFGCPPTLTLPFPKGATMEPEERNRVMDAALPWLNLNLRAEWYEAIRKCEELARAWDRACKKVKAETGDCAKWHKDIMDKALTPTPQDPLEELEEFVNRKKWDLMEETVVNTNGLLAEIRRLREKGKK